MSIAISTPFNANIGFQLANVQGNQTAQSRRAAISGKQADTNDINKLQLADESFFQKAYENLPKGQVIDSSSVEVAQQLVAQRNEIANQVDDATRYQLADEMAPDYITHLYNSINRVSVSSTGNESPKHVNPYDQEIYNDHITTYSAKTKNGTIINVSQTESDLDSSYRQAVQITRTNGLQINIALTDDLRINELEDGGLSVFYASNGITKHYSVDGVESIIESDNTHLGTESDDIIINKTGSQIISGAGDDIIFNFANNAVINAGAGNDKIIICNPEASGIQIDTGEGKDVVSAYSMSASAINLNDDDFLVAARINDSTITATGNISIKSEEINKSTLSTVNGKANINIGSVLESAVSIGDSDLVAIGSAYASNISLSSTNQLTALINCIRRGSNVNINAQELELTSASIDDSKVTIVSEKSNILSSSLFNSNLYTGDGEDNIHIDSVYSSSIYTNNGNDNLIFNSAMNSNINTGGGNDTITYRTETSSQITSGSGKNIVNSNVRPDKIYNKNLLSNAAKAWENKVIFEV